MRKLLVGKHIDVKNAICDWCGEEKECFESQDIKIPITQVVNSSAGPLRHTHYEETRAYICQNCVNQLAKKES